jgi:uncharacterized membrane protein YgaE (UPF0421/DUF939 family)
MNKKKPQENNRMTQQYMQSLLILHIRHALKTGFACVLAYGISYAVGLQFALWAVISTIIAMQGMSVADSLQHSLMRFSGMAIGAIMGMGLLLIAPDNLWLLGGELFFLTALGSYVTRYGNRYMLASTAACILLLGGKMAAGSLMGIDPLTYGLTLVVEVFIGVSAALLVSFLVWPVRMGDTLRDDLSRQFNTCADLLSKVVTSYLNGQQHVSYQLLDALDLQTWGNHERINKVRRLEAYFYRGHKSLKVQVSAIDRTVEGLHGLIDVLNEYEEQPYDPMLGPQVRALSDHIISGLRHLAGPQAFTPEPAIVRGMTEAVVVAEQMLNEYRLRDDTFNSFPLHRLLQTFTCYQTLRTLTEELLLSMYDLQVLAEKEGEKKIRARHRTSLIGTRRTGNS